MYIFKVNSYSECNSVTLAGFYFIFEYQGGSSKRSRSRWQADFYRRDITWTETFGALPNMRGRPLMEHL